MRTNSRMGEPCTGSENRSSVRQQPQAARRRIRRGFSAGIALLTVLAACQTTPRIAGGDTQVLTQGRLAALNPSDIAVAPVILASADIEAPIAQIRRGAQYGLTTRLYSPLSNELVDQSVGGGVGDGSFTPATVNASYIPGDLGEDAVLEIYVERWDASNWEIRRSVDVAIEARMVDPRDPTGPELWVARLDRKFDFSGTIEGRAAGRKAVQDACNKIFREMMAKLPVRDTAPRTSLDFEPAR